jgi:hypothetical protein
MIIEKVNLPEVHSENDWTLGLLNPEPKVSNCCGAKMYGVDSSGVGICSDCGDLAEEVECE